MTLLATPELLRAYLDWQAEMGTEEVVLPSPMARRAAPAPISAPAQTDVRMHASAAAPAFREPAREEPTTAPAGLFATLSQALQGGPAAAAQATAAAAATAAKTRLPEATSLPEFADLAAYWAHLEANPGTAAGDPGATVTRVIRGVGGAGAPLALVGLEPGEADAAAGLSFQGEPGALLAKMLKAIRLEAADCYLTHLVKAARDTRTGRREIARLIPWLHHELSYVRAPFVILLGEACAQAVLKTGKTLEDLRQEPHRIEGREFMVTYHPSDLLKREELKRRAWEDLQWLQKRMAAAKAEA